MLQFTFLFLCEFQDCGDKFHQPGNEHFALSLTSGCYDYCAYILQQAVVSEVIIYSRLFILFTLQSGNIHNIHNLIVGVHAMDGQSPSKEWWLLKPKNGLDNKSSKITHPFQMNQYWPGKKTHSSNPHLRKSGPGKPQNAGRFSGGVTCLLVLRIWVSRFLWSGSSRVVAASSQRAIVWQVCGLMNAKCMFACSVDVVQISNNFNTFSMISMIYTFLSEINSSIDTWTIGVLHYDSGACCFFFIHSWSRIRYYLFSWFQNFMEFVIEISIDTFIRFTAWWAWIRVDSTHILWFRGRSEAMAVVSITMFTSVLSIVPSSCS